MSLVEERSCLRLPALLRDFAGEMKLKFKQGFGINIVCLNTGVL
jgi:hypothetical protein